MSILVARQAKGPGCADQAHFSYDRKGGEQFRQGAFRRYGDAWTVAFMMTSVYGFQVDSVK